MINDEESFHESGDDFLEPGPKVAKPVSSLKHVSRNVVGLSSKSEASIKKLQWQILKLEGNQKIILFEVEDLKSIVKEQRVYIDLELMKLCDILIC